MSSVLHRLASLAYLARPLALVFVGIVLLSLGAAYLLLWVYQTAPLPGFVFYLTLQFLPGWLRGLLFVLGGAGVLAAGIWQLSSVVVLPRDLTELSRGEIELGSRAARRPLRIVVLSGGAGVLVLSRLSAHAKRLTCITPLHDPIEYYYRASGLVQFQNVYYVVPTPTPQRVQAQLDSGTLLDVMHVDMHSELAPCHVARLALAPPEPPTNGAHPPALTRLAREAIAEADAILLGPGSLFESVVPNFLLPELRAAVAQSNARTIFICNLMTEPGLTTGFSVADHIRTLKQYAGFAPDYVLVNAQRLDSEVSKLYAAANQTPVMLSPDEYEETAVPAHEQMTRQQVLVEGSVVIEADLASSMVQARTSLGKPGESHAVRVLRHDPDKLADALLELLRRR